MSRIDLKSGEEVLLCEDLPFFDSDTSYIQFVLDGKIVADITDADPQTRESPITGMQWTAKMDR